MFGISYGELFLILGATVALIGPKDLPKIARTAGLLTGRAIGYVQMARGQFESVVQQSQASKVHKELQDTMAQLEAIRYEMRTISFMNPGPLTRRLDTGQSASEFGRDDPERPDGECKPAAEIPKSFNTVKDSVSSNLHSQATVYARLSEASSIKASPLKVDGESDKPGDGNSLLTVLPVSAESAGLLPKDSDYTGSKHIEKIGSLDTTSSKCVKSAEVKDRRCYKKQTQLNKTKGSDILLEAILEAEVAQNAKHFFSQPENQIQKNE